MYHTNVLFGVPDQGQMLVRWHLADVSSEVAVMLLRGEVTTSARYEILNR
jgi:hypothetical protein